MEACVEMIRQIGDLAFVNGVDNPTEVTLGELEGVCGCIQNPLETPHGRVLLNELERQGVIAIEMRLRSGLVALTRKGEEFYHLYSR